MGIRWYITKTLWFYYYWRMDFRMSSKFHFVDGSVLLKEFSHFDETSQRVIVSRNMWMWMSNVQPFCFLCAYLDVLSEKLCSIRQSSSQKSVHFYYFRWSEKNLNTSAFIQFEDIVFLTFLWPMRKIFENLLLCLSNEGDMAHSTSNHTHVVS